MVECIVRSAIVQKCCLASRWQSGLILPPPDVRSMEIWSTVPPPPWPVESAKMAVKGEKGERVRKS